MLFFSSHIKLQLCLRYEWLSCNDTYKSELCWVVQEHLNNNISLSSHPASQIELWNFETSYISFTFLFLVLSF